MDFLLSAIQRADFAKRRDVANRLVALVVILATDEARPAVAFATSRGAIAVEPDLAHVEDQNTARLQGVGSTLEESSQRLAIDGLIGPIAEHLT